jgi:DNA-binding transcriptional regulator LsrR (DeoR family)
VQITIDSSVSSCIGLEAGLAKAFGLRRAIVVPSALEYDVISRQLCRSLRDAGAVGDVCSHYLDITGNPIVHPIAARTINPTLDDLRGVPELILAAGGRQKVSIIRSAILARLCHVLITDESAASALLAEKSK